MAIARLASMVRMHDDAGQNPRSESAYRAWLRALGASVAEWRGSIGMTQAQAAEACGYDIKFYQDIEYGRRPISTRTLFAVARGLGARVSDIIPHGAAEAVASGESRPRDSAGQKAPRPSK